MRDPAQVAVPLSVLIEVGLRNDRRETLLKQHIDLMRPVVDAAVAWLDGTHDGGQQDALIRAIEAYQREVKS